MIKQFVVLRWLARELINFVPCGIFNNVFYNYFFIEQIDEGDEYGKLFCVTFFSTSIVSLIMVELQILSILYSLYYIT